jgi:hypothetical protein
MPICQRALMRVCQAPECNERVDGGGCRRPCGRGGGRKRTTADLSRARSWRRPSGQHCQRRKSNGGRPRRHAARFRIDQEVGAVVVLAVNTGRQRTTFDSDLLRLRKYRLCRRRQSQPRRLGEVDAESVSLPLIPAGHLGAGVAELWRSSTCAAVARPARNECPENFCRRSASERSPRTPAASAVHPKR